MVSRSPFFVFCFDTINVTTLVRSLPCLPSILVLITVQLGTVLA